MIWFDRGHLHQVLWNLVGNAVRHCSGDSAVASVVLQVRRPGFGSLVELHVSDDGPGISAEDRSHMFEPFFTTRSSGTGLGLYIARELCEANERGDRPARFDMPGGHISGMTGKVNP